VTAPLIVDMLRVRRGIMRGRHRGAWLAQRMLWDAPSVNLPYGASGGPEMPARIAFAARARGRVMRATSQSRATLVGSYGLDGKHWPVVDIDVPARLIPSTTPGHAHLYVNHPTTFPRLIAMLAGLAAAGVIDWTIVWTAIFRGMSCVRPPWVHKIMTDGDRRAEWAAAARGDV